MSKNAFNFDVLLASDPVLSAIPHADQLFGAWAIYEPAMEALLAQIELLDLANHLNSPMAIAARDRAAAPVQLEVNSDGIAIVRIVGPMQKQESSFGGSSTITARCKLREAARNDQIRGVMIWGETPGGTVAGTAELGDEIAALAKKKPVHAYGEDMVASAGFWALSQASRFSVNRMCQVGSIGTVAVVHDYSRQADARGVKVHVIRAGQFKGMGTPGTEITPEQIAWLQNHVNTLNEHFLQAVASGRSMKLEDVRALADGGVHIGEEAKRRGLVDAVSTFDEALAALVKSLPRRSSQSMSTEITTPPARVAATIQEIKAGCPGATDAFMVEQLSRGSTLNEAQVAWMQEQAKAQQALEEKLKSEEAKAATAEAKVKELEAKTKSKNGVDPIKPNASAESAAYEGDARADWNEKIAAKVKQGMSRPRAVSAVNRENPGLREAMVAAAN